MSPRTGMKHNRKRVQALLFDYWIVVSVLVLTVLGLVMVFSASGIMAGKYWADSTLFFRKQLVFTVLGVGILFFVSWIDRRFIYKLVYVWLALAIVFLILTLTPMGVEAGGARRWLNHGFFSFQPLELAKVALIIYLASFYSRKQDMVKTFSIGFFPPLVITGVICFFLILQPDFGGAVFIAMLLLMMSMVGGTRLVYLVATVLTSATAAVFLIVQSPYRFRRWFAFLDPFEDAYDTGYQLVQSMYALGAGGWSGLGLGSGRQKLFFLPEAHNDFILAVLGEELGFIGISLVFVCLFILLWRAFLITIRQEELQDRFTAFGMALILGLGALLNAAVVLGAVPPKGVPMPFLSYGGSNLLISFFCAGVLLNLSREVRT